MKLLRNASNPTGAARSATRPRLVIVTPHAEWVQSLVAWGTAEEGRLSIGADEVLQLWREHSAVATSAHAHDLARTGAEVILLGPGVPLDDCVALAQLLDTEHPEMSTLLLAPRTADTLDLALRAGARGVIDPETDPADLVRILSDVLEVARGRHQRLAGNVTTANPASPNRVITVLAAKGGVGKTMLSTNLAVALARQFPGEVVLVDTDLQFGDIATSLGIEPDRTISDTVPLGDGLDATTLKAFLTPRASANVYALCAPLSPADADELTPEHVGHVLELLHQEFRYVVVDTTAGIDEMALQAIDRSTDLVVLTSTDVPSIRAAAKELRALEMLGVSHLRWHLVLNRADARVGLNVDDIEATLGRTIGYHIPSSRSLPLSVNHGIPLVESDPKSAPSRVVLDLADHVSGVTSDRPTRRKDRP